MKTNEQTITGVLHLSQSQRNYQLRRYFSDKLPTLIEQYWLVNWQLNSEHTHTQKNLPDPNPHLFFDGKSLKLLGPVSKVYEYKMQDRGGIVGVKFAIGALAEIVNFPMTELIDQERQPDDLLKLDSRKIIVQLQQAKSDKQAIEILEDSLAHLNFTLSDKQRFIQQLFHQIKHNDQINTVEQLANELNISVRNIQRYCKQYIGLSPKWLLRKYRLHQMLEQIEQGNTDIMSLVAKLDYTDQAHLIKDMKQMLGITPKQYLQQ